MKHLTYYGIDHTAEQIREYQSIIYMVEERSTIYDSIEGDENPDYSQVDYLKEMVLEKLVNVKTVAPIDFILEVLDHLGFAPCLINDDDGHWAVGGDGICSVNMEDDGPVDFTATMFVEKDKFADTIREAIVKFIDRLVEE